MVFQGDGLARVWVSNLPDPTVREARVVVLSNTCDVAPENKRPAAIKGGIIGGSNPIAPTLCSGAGRTGLGT